MRTVEKLQLGALPLVEVLKVSSKSNPNSVAGALAGVVRGCGAVEVQVVGAGALNQAIKAVAIARGYVASSGLDLTCRPTFADIEIDGERRTAIKLLVEACEPGVGPPWKPPSAARTDREVDLTDRSIGMVTTNRPIGEVGVVSHPNA